MEPWVPEASRAMLALCTALAGLLLLLPLLGNLLFPYWWQDLATSLSIVHKGYRCLRRLQCRPPLTLLDTFLEKVQSHPEKALLLFGEQVYTYRDIDRRSSQAARVLRDGVGLREGDSVAVFLLNIPAYLWVWLGLAKIGCAMACLNTNIRANSLLHSLGACGATVLLTTPGEWGGCYHLGSRLLVSWDQLHPRDALHSELHRSARCSCSKGAGDRPCWLGL